VQRDRTKIGSPEMSLTNRHIEVGAGSGREEKRKF
jgi:hypothetical protein